MTFNFNKLNCTGLDVVIITRVHKSEILRNAVIGTLNFFDFFLSYAAQEGKLEIIEYIMKKWPKMIHIRDNLDHTAFTIAKDLNTVEFLLEKFMIGTDVHAINQTSVLNYKHKKSNAKLSAVNGAFLVTCQYGNVQTITMITEKLRGSFGIKPWANQRTEVNLVSKDHERRNGFFLAALNYKTKIMRYFINKYPELTLNTKDIYGITFSKNLNDITCPHINTPDTDLTISMIGSVSETGALKQRKIVRRLKKSIRKLEDFDNSIGRQSSSDSNLSDIMTDQLDCEFDTLRNIDNKDCFSDNDEEILLEHFKESTKEFDKLYKIEQTGKITWKKNYLGQGGFGIVIEATDTTNKRKVAVKIESANYSNPRLLYEYKIYEVLDGIEGFPKAYNYFSYGIQNQENRLVLELLGDSLETCFRNSQQEFTIKDVLMIGIQAIERIESFHKKGFIHRDIKPENMLFGRNENSNKLYLVDFGLSKKYLVNKKHIKFREGKSLIGTVRYCSINAHTGKETSRRDDLISLGYVLTYLLKGKEGLPWQNLVKDKDLTKKEWFEYLLKLKQDYIAHKLFSESGLCSIE